MKRIVILLILTLFIVEYVSSQRSARWRRMRYEIIYGLGATNFLGELGGANRVGTNFVRDLEYVMTRPMASLGMRYKLREEMSVKAALSGGYLRGDDKTTTQIHRNNRNLNFKSLIIEFGAQYEYSVIKERIGHRYNLRRIRGVRGFKTNTYFFVGLAGFYMNPKGRYVDGSWHALQPLGTEGQGLVPTRKKYSRFQVAIPYGIGFKYGLDRKWSLGLEFGVRKTFTDYIDDVSTTYYSYDLIKESKGDVAAYLSDPSLGRWDGVADDKDRWTGPNTQRGDAKDKDTYMFVILNLTYKLRTTRKGLPKF